MKKTHIGLLVIFFMVFAATAFAFGPGFQGGGGPCYGGQGGPGFHGSRGYGYGGGFGAGMGNYLNLTKEQQDKFWQAKEKFHNDTSALRYELFQKRTTLRSLYADPNADETTLRAKQTEVNALRQKLSDKAAQFKIEQRKILTPEQIKKLGEANPGRGYYGPCGYGGRYYGKGYGPGPGRG